MGAIDTTVIIIVVSLGLLIMYRALKEPIDLLFSGIKNMFGLARDKMTDTAEGGVEVIRYG